MSQPENLEVGLKSIGFAFLVAYHARLLYDAVVDGHESKAAPLKEFLCALRDLEEHLVGDEEDQDLAEIGTILLETPDHVELIAEKMSEHRLCFTWSEGKDEHA